mmetsp:Transcript_9991/g.21487  ORF Transcript_9991/g.21487 Transcript_9991/m.21487 type:complete len:215 (+) Transcript_9991:2745-3389(+)
MQRRVRQHCRLFLLLLLQSVIINGTHGTVRYGTGPHLIVDVLAFHHGWKSVLEQQIRIGGGGGFFVVAVGAIATNDRAVVLVFVVGQQALVQCLPDALLVRGLAEFQSDKDYFLPTIPDRLGKRRGVVNGIIIVAIILAGMVNVVEIRQDVLVDAFRPLVAGKCRPPLSQALVFEAGTRVAPVHAVGMGIGAPHEPLGAQGRPQDGSRVLRDLQ